MNLLLEIILGAGAIACFSRALWLKYEPDEKPQRLNRKAKR